MFCNTIIELKLTALFLISTGSFCSCQKDGIHLKDTMDGSTLIESNLIFIPIFKPELLYLCRLLYPG